jgi:lysophospholipase L1-like esterase
MKMKIVKAVGAWFFLLPSFAGAQTAVTNQHLFDTVPNMPAHYQERVARFKQEPVTTVSIVFLGNSITEGGNWAELLGDSTVVNRGIGGDITFGVLARLDDVIRRKPAKLFILIGINDIGMDIPDAVIADNYRKIIGRVKAGSPATKIYVQSLFPLNPDVKGFPQHYDKQEHVLHVNGLLKKVASDTRCQFVNLFPLFLDGQKRLNPKYTGDGLHLNEAGYLLWVKHLKQNGCL